MQLIAKNGNGLMIGKNEFHKHQFSYINDNLWFHFRVVIFHFMIDFLRYKKAAK